MTTIQDGGRPGFQKFGVPVGGAVDRFAMAAANALVGNHPGEGALEITILGPTLRFHIPCLIALTGANLSPQLDGQPLAQWEAMAVSSGAELRFGPYVRGCRTYLAVAGGFAIPTVLGSKSTYLRGGFGGFEGRALRAGDQLPLASPNRAVWRREGLRLRNSDIPTYSQGIVVGALPGPQADLFGGASIATFFDETFAISSASDRMGYRLEGPRIIRSGPAETISEGVALGTVQVPGDGRPIILMADRQTVGGYPKIANVISADIPALAQCFPGQGSVRFRPTTQQEARRRLRQQQTVIEKLRPLGGRGVL